MTPFPREAFKPLVPYVPDPRPVPWDLSDNTNLWGTHPAALEALRNATEDDLARYPTGYGDRLKESVAESVGVGPECVATDCGSDDLLDSAFRAACDPGERVAFPVPTFSMIPLLTRMNDLDTDPVEPPRDWREKGSLLPPVDRLLEGDPSAVYVCSPNNPTGEVAPREWIEALLDAAAAEGGPVVVVDEAYAEFDERSFLADAPHRKRVVVTRTLSKAYGLAGLRVGYGVGDPELIHEIEKSRGPYKVGRLSEACAVAALADREGWTSRVTDEVRTNRKALVQALEERGLRPLPSGSNFLLLPVADGARVAEGIRAHGVAVRPLPDLPGVGDGLRITVGPWEGMERLLEAVDQVLAPASQEASGG